jgi:hypothetical protein
MGMMLLCVGTAKPDTSAGETTDRFGKDAMRRLDDTERRRDRGKEKQQLLERNAL